MQNKKRGHYCWVCGRMRPNERFSGSGRRRHICGDCKKLGSEELAYQQNVRNIERCFHGIHLRRNQRKTFAKFLKHDDPRVRAYAEEMKLDFEREYEKQREQIENDHSQEDEFDQEISAEPAEPWIQPNLDDIPF